jgi:hypothetical protein
VPLVDFVRWADVQELLSSGALTSDALAAAIEKTGTTVEKGDLTFETVSDVFVCSRIILRYVHNVVIFIFAIT